MNLIVKIKVNENYKKVFSAFNKQLFLALVPPLMPVKLLRFDGCNKGDQVHIQFPFNQKWISHITENFEDDKQIYFVDESSQLPFPFKKWRHKHIIQKVNQNQTLIIEDIQYQTINPIFDYLVYPILKLQFLYRKRIYPNWKY